MPSNPIFFDTDGLYVVLSNMGEAFHFHWGLFLATTPDEGTTFHVTNGPGTGFKWTYETKLNKNLKNSVTLIYASKIAVVDPVLHQPLAEQLAAVSIASSPRYGPISCRSWVR